jgi:hypothetical protein
LGNPENRTEPERRRMGAATVQTLFTFLADPSSAALPARQLAELAGAGKSAVSEARQRLIGEGVLEGDDSQFRIADSKRLQAWFLDGFSYVLRPHIFRGAFEARNAIPSAGSAVWPPSLKRRAGAGP